MKALGNEKSEEGRGQVNTKHSFSGVCSQP